MTKNERGYTLLEVLIALGITLVVMALVARTLQDVMWVSRLRSRCALASPPLMRPKSCIATSSRRTSCSPIRAM